MAVPDLAIIITLLRYNFCTYIWLLVSYSILMLTFSIIIYLFACLFACLFVCLFVYLCLYLFMYLFIYSFYLGIQFYPLIVL